MSRTASMSEPELVHVLKGRKLHIVVGDRNLGMIEQETINVIPDGFDRLSTPVFLQVDETLFYTFLLRRLLLVLGAD